MCVCLCVCEGRAKSRGSERETEARQRSGVKRDAGGVLGGFVFLLKRSRGFEVNNRQEVEVKQ